jgi:hypothetical protein
MTLHQIILDQAEPFDYVYDALEGLHGTEIRDYLYDMYSQVSIDYRLHPDDDFEPIIELMIQNMERDS